MRLLIVLLLLWSSYWVYHYIEKSKKNEQALTQTIRQTVETKSVEGAQLVRDVEVVVKNQVARNERAENSTAIAPAPPPAEEGVSEAQAWNTELEQLELMSSQNPSEVIQRLQSEIKQAKNLTEATRRLLYLTKFGGHRTELAALTSDLLSTPPPMESAEDNESLKQTIFSIFVSNEQDPDTALTKALDVLASETDEGVQTNMANQFLNRFPEQLDHLKPVIEQKLGRPL
jgi:uncharacterized protein YihD (DUF1040 family)